MFYAKNIINHIKRNYSANKLPHNFLIYGPPGSGKSHLMYQILQVLVPNYVQNYHSIISHPDIYSICSEKNLITLDMIRKLKLWLKTKPLQELGKIIIIHDVDLMNINAANAFLKILEEPNRNTFIIMDTSDFYSLIPTLRSRCLILRLAALSFTQFFNIMKEAYNNLQMTNARELYEHTNANPNLGALYLKYEIIFDMSNKDLILDQIKKLDLSCPNKCKIFQSLVYKFIIHLGKLSMVNQNSSEIMMYIKNIHYNLQNFSSHNKSITKDLIIPILKIITLKNL